jgi:iron complex outermembrane receptor protein
VVSEISGGDFGFVQAKGMATGTLVDNLVAGRVSFAVTRRRGILYNVRNGASENTIGTLAARGELLYQPASDLQVRLSADYSEFGARCCTQVYVGVGTTLKTAARQR